MPLYRDEGVVLRTAKLGEADRIITMLTRGHGKIRAVAKGVRRTKSRFGARLEPFMRADLLIATGRSLDVVSQAESVAAYAEPICADYDAYTAANVIVETADKIVGAEEERVAGQYRLLIGALNALARHAHAPEHISASYVMRALALAGWTPRLHSCVVCGKRRFTDGFTEEIAARPMVGATVATAMETQSPQRFTDGFTNGAYLSVPAGGLMCAKDHTPEARRVTPLVLAQLEALTDGDWTELDGRELAPETSRLVEDWAEYYLERPLRSMRLLD
ncbi:DNA repair protein RecO [Bifidobacterium platyrrhinorum]|uniref:DNA repair protein RecO n=1 Tax=Bifidobacterium platyrrhinorum TaxID=2661628 RepID=A0A6L9SNU6_9BIFI|nr:DNA repair protein RecO [Bifidobacterium platyrrhinorum]NEG54207.1 DNA repair protein RecO [Bifidobacterium platyrrhinorum]